MKNVYEVYRNYCITNYQKIYFGSNLKNCRWKLKEDLERNHCPIMSYSIYKNGNLLDNEEVIIDSDGYHLGLGEKQITFTSINDLLKTLEKRY